jgi:hypothetical protein
MVSVSGILAEAESAKDKSLLAEIEDILRTVPPEATHRHPTNENFAWFGRAQAAMGRWDRIKAELFRSYVNSFQAAAGHAREIGTNRPKMIIMLNEARMDIRSRVGEPLAEIIDGGQPFQYFDEVRKLVQLAQGDLLFVDPYIDAEFVSRFLPHVNQSATVRLLTSKCIPAALSAVAAFVLQPP